MDRRGRIRRDDFSGRKQAAKGAKEMSVVVFFILFGLVVVALFLAIDLMSRSEIFSNIIKKITPQSRSDRDSDE